MDQIFTAEKELLKELAIRANNIIMNGSFSGDNITEAAEVMKLCHKIVDILNGTSKRK
jgi:hypothetical protein